MPPTSQHTCCQVKKRKGSTFCIAVQQTVKPERRKETSLGDIFTSYQALEAELYLGKMVKYHKPNSDMILGYKHDGLFKTTLANQCDTQTIDMRTSLSSSSLIVFRFKSLLWLMELYEGNKKSPPDLLLGSPGEVSALGTLSSAGHQRCESAHCTTAGTPN